MKCDFQASLLARTFASLCLGCEPKARVVTFWRCSLFPLSKALELRTSQLVACFRCPFSLAYVDASYGYCYSCCSCSTKVEKEKEVATIQEHKKPSSKRNPKNSKPRKICRFQH
jgi:hypothetical protein